MALERTCVVCNGASHREATVGANREGHEGLQREADSRRGLRQPQGENLRNACIGPVQRGCCARLRWGPVEDRDHTQDPRLQRSRTKPKHPKGWSSPRPTPISHGASARRCITHSTGHSPVAMRRTKTCSGQTGRAKRRAGHSQYVAVSAIAVAPTPGFSHYFSAASPSAFRTFRPDGNQSSLVVKGVPHYSRKHNHESQQGTQEAEQIPIDLHAEPR
jgi:hypothetical protein